MCFLYTCFSLNPFWHISQVNRYSPVCTDRWYFSLFLSMNGFEQYSQWYFRPSCALMWSLKCAVALNPFRHSSQWYLYCPVWICLCWFKLLVEEYCFPQISQANHLLSFRITEAFSDLITWAKHNPPFYKNTKSSEISNEIFLIIVHVGMQYDKYYSLNKTLTLKVISTSKTCLCNAKKTIFNSFLHVFCQILQETSVHAESLHFTATWARFTWA